MTCPLILGPDNSAIPLRSRADLSADASWQTRLRHWQGQQVRSQCCGGTHPLTVFTDPLSGLLSLRAAPGTRNEHHADCPAVGYPDAHATTPSIEPDSFAVCANHALDRAYLDWWRSPTTCQKLPWETLRHFQRAWSGTKETQAGIVEATTIPECAGSHMIRFAVLDALAPTANPPATWLAASFGNEVTGRTEILGSPIRTDYMVLAEFDPDYGEQHFVERIHCWPLARVGDAMHVVHSKAEDQCAALLSAQFSRFLKPPSIPFLRLLAESSAELSQLAQLCVEYDVWPDYLCPSGEIGHIVELLGKTDLEYIRRALTKFDLYRRLAHECGLRWHALVPTRNGGFQTIAGSDDHFTGVLP